MESGAWKPEARNRILQGRQTMVIILIVHVCIKGCAQISCIKGHWN